MARAMRKVFRGAAIILALLVVLIGGALFVLLETSRGHDFILRESLTRLNAAIAGEVSVGGIHSAGILRGLTLTDVRIVEPDGREFLRADSMRAGYSVRGFIRGDVIISPVELWSPRVTIERLPGEEDFNFARIFAGDPDPTGEPPDRRIALERARIHDGEFIVRLPVAEGDEPMDRAILEEVEGGVVQRFVFENVDAEVPQLLIQEPGSSGEFFRVAALSMTAWVLEAPFRVSDVRGTLEREGGRLSFNLDRLWLEESEFAGDGFIDWTEETLFLEFDLDSDIVHFADFRWAVPDLPDVTGSVSILTTGYLDEGAWTFANADLQMDGSRITGGGGLRLGTELRLVDVDIETLPVDLADLKRLGILEALPFDGLVRGRARVDGPLQALAVSGRLSLTTPSVERAVTGEFEGVVDADGPIGVTDFGLLLEPFHFGILRTMVPDFPLTGPGSVYIEATGRFDTGLHFSAEVDHTPSDAPHSRVALRGAVVGDLTDPDREMRLDLDGDLDPLSLAMVARFFPELPLTGVATGSFTLEGALGDLAVGLRLETPGGPVVAEARFDAFDPGARYTVEAELSDFDVARVFEGAPDPSRITGTAFLDGRGIERETMWANARVDVGPSRIGELIVDHASTFLRIDAGMITIDTLVVESPVMDVKAAGTLGFAEGRREGEVRISLASESLEALRPFLAEGAVIAGDTLTGLERDALEMAGVNTGALPDERSVAMGGRLAGEALVTGSIDDFQVDGTLTFADLLRGEDTIEEAKVTFLLRGLPALDLLDATASVEAEGIQVAGLDYAGASGEISYRDRRGNAAMRIQRDPVEHYRARAAFELQEGGGVVHLDELTLRFDETQWNLGAPSRIAWSDERLSVSDFRLVRPAVRGGMRIEAEGTLEWGGAVDFRLVVDSLSLGRIARLGQVEEDVDGSLTLRLDVTGTARDPIAKGVLAVRDFRFGDVFLSSIEGDVAYSGRRASGDLIAWQDDLRVFKMTGGVPIDLSFESVAQRLLDDPMDLHLSVDRFPAAVALGFLEDLRSVEGVLSGEIDIRGTAREPAPSGTMQLRRGAATIPDMGVRYTGVEAILQLEEDGRVLVNAEAHSRGSARVEGTITLDPVRDPGFDLIILANNFQAADRRDVTARVGGEVTLTGRYRSPVVRGNVRVEQGVLFLEEFTRAAEVIDLAGSDLFTVASASPTAAGRIEASGNPFLQNLRVDIDLVVARDTWLRSREMNVEIGGALLVEYDRTRNEIILSGALAAIRGDYMAFGRRFQVREGAVDFIGTPGIDPNLDIRAVHRLRREGGQPLGVIASLTGTLTNPSLSLSSESEPPIAESDLVSYLIFGRPSFALAQGEVGALRGAMGALGPVVVGAFAGELGAAVAQQIGIDYFVISQAEDARGITEQHGALAGTQVELGHYVFDELFVAMTLRPPRQFQSALPGARAEWRFTDLWTVEGFVEDRFQRSGISGFSELGIRLDRVWGFSIFRDWGF